MPNELTVLRASTRKPLASPVSTSVMAKTKAVPMTAMMNRRRRHCRSRKAAVSIAGI